VTSSAKIRVDLSGEELTLRNKTRSAKEPKGENAQAIA
jgi:hypothetical protein